MLKRVTALLLLAAMLLAVLPVSAAEQNIQVEDFTVEQADSAITVIPPENYAEKGFFKLFWKNNQTGETLNAVFPVDTAAYEIQAEAGAQYSFQLFYAKKRGLLPAAWKEEKAEEPMGPGVWKVLWIDLDTVDCLGITNQMTEENHRVSGEISGEFEKLVEELSDGRVDIEITRMTIEQPFTALSYDVMWGYRITQDDLDAKHYSIHKYDSVIVIAPLDQFAHIYAGITTAPENPREQAGYAVVPLTGDEISEPYKSYLSDVCVHEWIHQLGNFYSEWQLEIPNPDTPEQFGYDPYSGRLDQQYFRAILTMTAQAEDGRLLGVPEEAWQYSPTHNPSRWNLSYLQDQEVPADFRPREKQPVITPELPEGPDIFELPNGIVYENKTMGLGCALENWLFFTREDYWNYLNTIRSPAREYSDEDPDFLKNNDPVTMMYMVDSQKPGNVTFRISTAAVPFVKQYGEAAYAEEIKKFYDRLPSESSPAGFSYKIIQRRIGSRDIPGIKFSYTLYNNVKAYTEELYWLNGDLLNTLSVETSMFDNCDGILDHFFLLSDPYRYKRP